MRNNPAAVAVIAENALHFPAMFSHRFISSQLHLCSQGKSFIAILKVVLIPFPLHNLFMADCVWGALELRHPPLAALGEMGAQLLLHHHSLLQPARASCSSAWV